MLWWYVIEKHADDAAICSEIVLIGTTGRVRCSPRCRVMHCAWILAMDEDNTTGAVASLYALDAVSHDERLQIERWLDLADSVRRDDFLREVAAVRSTMEFLAATTAVDPPPRLRRRLLARVLRHRHSSRYSGECAQPIRRDFPTKAAAMVAESSPSRVFGANKPRRRARLPSAGLIALLTAITYALLSKSYASRGGTVTFVNRAFGTEFSPMESSCCCG